MKSILALLISNITGINKEYIYKNLIYEDPYIGKNTIIHKDNTVDLHVEIEDNSIMLEMNESNRTYTRFNNATHFYSGVVDRFLVSKNYENVGILYQINSDNNHPFSDELISRIMMRDDNGKLDEKEKYFRKYKVNLSFFSEKGISQCIEQKAVETAKNLLKNNVDINIIADSTGLSITDIKNLLNFFK